MSNESELPADVRETLSHLFAEASGYARRRDGEELDAVLGTVERVVENEVPPGEIHDRLDHGCATVQRLAADEPLVAAEYLRSMQELVEDAD